MHHVVQTTLDEPEHFFTRGAAQMGGAHVVSSELLLQKPVDATHLLLLAKPKTILRKLDAPLAVLTGRIRTTRHRAFLREAAIAFEIELAAFTTTKLTNWSEITCHN
jgi:hypothetical protein